MHIEHLLCSGCRRSIAAADLTVLAWFRSLMRWIGNPRHRPVVELLLTSTRCAGTVRIAGKVNVRCSLWPVHALDPLLSFVSPNLKPKKQSLSAVRPLGGAPSSSC